MNDPACPRKWQIQAARDGRLIGKDLANAARHREACADCANEERELAAVGSGLARLPELTRDPLTAQRSRQRLLAALNKSVIDPAPKGAAWPGASAAALALVSGLWLAFAHRKAAKGPRPIAQRIVEVHAQAGARWSRYEDPSHIFVDLREGAASLKIHPHPGRSVVVRLPDGEIEDVGTVFDVQVNHERTQHIAVTEGRVAVRLRGRATLNLSAGQHWDSPEDALITSPAAAVSSTIFAEPEHVADATAKPSHLDKPLPTGRAARVAATPFSRAGSASSAHSAAPSDQSTKAEDDAYLRIVSLLRAGEESCARAEAKNYLLRFPNGFRRIEVLNIATHNPGAKAFSRTSSSGGCDSQGAPD